MTGRGRGNILQLMQEYAASASSERSAEDSGLGTGSANNTAASRGFGRGSLAASFTQTVRVYFYKF